MKNGILFLLLLFFFVDNGQSPQVILLTKELSPVV